MNVPTPFVKKSRKTSAWKESLNADKKSCVDLEDLFQFESARQRALSQADPKLQKKPFNQFYANRIFINQVDTFNGSHIADFLSNIKLSHGEDIQNVEPDTVKKESEEIKTKEDDEDEEELEEESVHSVQEKDEFYEIIGSLEFLNNQKYRRPEGISELVDNEKKSEFLEKICTCGFIIYDISSDLYCHPKQVEEARWVIESLVSRLEIFEKKKPKEFSKYTQCRVFILISTLMTWAKTKPIDPEDSQLPLTEKDFRKRRPHPNYKLHCELEKRVTELGKRYPNNLKTIVIASGITYGAEEDVLHFLFKMAWQDAPYLPIFKPGNNIIPVIHIDSLASIIYTILQNFPDKFKYIIATDPHSVTQKELVKLLAKNLGNGKTKVVDKAEAFLFPDIKQRNYDMLSANINVAPGYILDHMVVKWGTALPFLENISELISQFKTARELLPVKIFIHGPPASGKTFLAKRLAHYYDVPHLTPKGVVEEAINKLKERIKEKEEENENREKMETEEETQEEEMEEVAETGEDLESLRRDLEEIEETFMKVGDKLQQEMVLRLFKEKLSSNGCMNKGYVIDGYPESIEETKTLYAPLAEDLEDQPQEEEDVQEDNLAKLCNLKILPRYVESLDASDEYLMNRMIRLPALHMTELEEHEMCRRLSEFRTLNAEDNTPLIFYDEMDVHPMIYNVENDPDVHMIPTFNAMINHIGPPHNYTKNEITVNDVFPEQTEDLKRAAQEEKRAAFNEKKREAEERRKNMQKWMLQKNQAIEMEEKALLIMGMPLRHYLMKYVFPCLTRGLVEVARVRPDDPVDFLSEFLFRENPEGKMFRPDYEDREKKLSDALTEYESKLKEGSTKSSGKSFSTDRSPRSDAISRVTNYRCSLVSKSERQKISKKHYSSGKTTGSGKQSYKSGGSSSKTSSSVSGSGSSKGVCTCQQSAPQPSLSTCSSDRTPSTASSCTCPELEPCEPCEPCEEEKQEEECVCPCDI